MPVLQAGWKRGDTGWSCGGSWRVQWGRDPFWVSALGPTPWVTSAGQEAQPSSACATGLLIQRPHLPRAHCSMETKVTCWTLEVRRGARAPEVTAAASLRGFLAQKLAPCSL